MRPIHTFFLILGMIFVAGCDDENGAGTPPPVTIIDAADAAGGFDTLLAAVDAADLTSTLSDPAASFTVFAPTDDAFALLGEDTISALLDDPDRLAAILTYHVLSGEVDAAAAISSAGSTVETVNGRRLAISLDGDDLLVNAATVTTADILTDNGIIHVIDAVLSPPGFAGTPTANIVDTAVAAGNFTSLVAALQATGLDATLADPNASFTVFAPTDAAFAMIDATTIETLFENPDVLVDILLQHVIAEQVGSIDAFAANGISVTTASGAGIPVAINAATDLLTYGGANVTVTDLYTSNGVIHVIDMVVVADVAIPAPVNSLVDVAIGAGSFQTLVTALQTAGLVALLDDPDASFTVFAPTDEAFALLGDDAIADLLAAPELLTDILTYHVISGAEVLQDAAVTFAQSGDNKVTMANGKMAALSYDSGALLINQSNVSSADIMADNGVIHVVDQVILPPSDRGTPTLGIVDTVLADTRFSTLVTALSAADLVDTLADETTTFTVFAPTNAAFEKIEDGALSGLLADTDALTRVLLQHVIVGPEITSLDAYGANGMNVDTAAGEDVLVSLVNFTATTNEADDEVAYNAPLQLLVGGTNSANPGHTLYTFADDLGTAGSACVGACITNWPAVLVTDNDVSNIPGLSMIMRENGDMQAAFQGRPLYFFANDASPGDSNGDGVGGLWSTVSQPQVSLQVQGANVSTTDIYTTHGVIHVIDTVITETLSVQ